ncbi:elongin-A-like [Orbicella faveolata]|uniref:elongin-A-like n=1 Tax=Orbicella faveolata TaxID=48498 RepID=UPI0009E4AC7F|nr:elongin-A-like [Orbicella faveolata]
MPSLEKYVQKIHKKLNNERLEEAKIKKYLQELDRIQITLDVLKATGIGRAVNRYRKHGNDVGDIASYLVTKWKELLKQEPGASQTSSSEACDKELSGSHVVRESKVDQINNKHDKSKHKTGEIKPKSRPTLQLCDISFGCEPVNINKQKKRPTASAGAATKMTSNESSRLELDLPPLPSSLSVTNLLLPEIQPTYKPVRLPAEFCDGSPKKKKGVVAGEVDEHALMSRKSRTQVFSGRRLQAGTITSLYELSMKILIENIDALGDTGGVPCDILQPVLEKCNPQQLLHLEECNPYFIDDTDPLWERHCCRDFKGTKPNASQSWRELYMQNEIEREDRLKKINQKIAASQAAKKPERQARIAYADTEAKPPRDVRKKQAKFGTGSGVYPSIPVIAPSRSTPLAHQRNLGSSNSPAKKHAVPAPMMKKTMKLFKNQRSRATTSIKRK